MEKPQDFAQACSGGVGTVAIRAASAQQSAPLQLLFAKTVMTPEGVRAVFMNMPI
jgi:hypothetical protein